MRLRKNISPRCRETFSLRATFRHISVLKPNQRSGAIRKLYLPYGPIALQSLLLPLSIEGRHCFWRMFWKLTHWKGIDLINRTVYLVLWRKLLQELNNLCQNKKIFSSIQLSPCKMDLTSDKEVDSIFLPSSHLPSFIIITPNSVFCPMIYWEGNNWLKELGISCCLKGLLVKWFTLFSKIENPWFHLVNTLGSIFQLLNFCMQLRIIR